MILLANPHVKKLNSILAFKKKYNPDVIIANAENATGGHGLSKKDAQDFYLLD